jgi:dTDP-glucose pyrophosphorylase
MKIIVPMAGRGSRFASTGFLGPKPLLSVAGKPMFSWALKSLTGIEYSRIVFIALEEHEEKWGITKQLKDQVGPQASVVLLPEVTEGQLCTVLAAREHISDNEDFVIASSDTYVVSDLGSAILKRTGNCRGIISVADMPGDRWSFVRVDATGDVIEVAEKVRISNYASTGLYYFANGREFTEIADELIRNREKTRGEYYVIPVYAKYLQRGWKVQISEAREMWDMGTPEAKGTFEHHLMAQRPLP